jgi:dTDP-4-amino-4,6-dideoxygalactose transaminase
MNAALAMVQFREAAKNLQKRKDIARAYTQSALQTRHKRFSESEEMEYNHYAFPLVLETGVKDVKAYAKRKEIVVESALEDTVVGCGRIPPAQCPESYSLSLRTVLFPLYPRLGASEIGKVVKLIGSLP